MHVSTRNKNTTNNHRTYAIRKADEGFDRILLEPVLLLISNSLVQEGLEDDRDCLL